MAPERPYMMCLFIILFFATPVWSSCSASVTGPNYGFSGALSQPTPYDGVTNYAANTTCQWKFDVADGLAFQFDFTALNLSCGDEVRFNYTSQLGKFVSPPLTCSSAPQVITLQGNSVTMVFYAAPDSPTATGVSFTYQTVPFTQCEGTRYINTTVTPQGVFGNPTPFGAINYTSIPGYGHCYYNVYVAPGYAAQINVTGLGIVNANLDVTSLIPPSTYKYVGYFDATTVLFATLWSSYSLQFCWTAGGVAPYAMGWRMHYTVVPDPVVGCLGEVSQSGMGGSFQPYSPYGGGLGLYREYSSCFWLLTAPSGYTVRLTIPSYALAAGDLVDVSNTYYDSSLNRLGILTGTSNTKAVFNSTGQYMYVAFCTNGRAAGFNATWEAIPLPPTPCAGMTNLTVDSGSLSSSLPWVAGASYAAGANCAWTITGTYGDYVSLNLQLLDLAVGDYLYVYNGPAMGPPMWSYTAGSALAVINSTGSLMTVVLEASPTGSGGHGFVASYTTPASIPFYCNCSYTTPVVVAVPSTGVLRTGVPCPYTGIDRYSNNMLCKWFFYDPLGKGVQVTFPRFYLESGYDYVKIYDGYTQSSSALLNTYNGYSPDLLTTASLNLTVVFNSDVSNTYSGFVMDASSSNVRNMCSGNKVFTTSSGTISVPIVGSPYDPNLSCTWKITVTRGYVASFTVTGADIADDMLVVADGPTADFPSLWKGQIGTPVNATTRTMFITFLSNAALEGNGFALTWTTITPVIQCYNNFYGANGCGGSLSFSASTAGTLAVPCPYQSYSQYAASLSCYLTMNAPTGYVITTRFMTFDLTTSGDYLYLYDGPTSSASNIATLYSTNEPWAYNYTSSSSSMTVRFSTGSTYPKGRGWALAYSIIPNPGKMCSSYTYSDTDATGGSISNPVPYGQGNYTQGLSCTWQITTSHYAYSGLEFVITDIDLGPGDFVNIYSGSSTSSPLLASATSPGTYTVGGAYMTVQFTSNAGQTGLGFQGYWRMTDLSGVCNSTTTYLTAQHLAASLAVPAYDSGFDSYAPWMTCSWLISPANPLETTYITFMNLNLGAGDQVILAQSTGGNIVTLTGRSYSSLTYSSLGSITVYFTSDAYDNGGGFKFHYSSGYPAPCPSTCVSRYNSGIPTWNNTRPYGLLGSACPYGGELTTPYNYVCNWRISSPYGHVQYSLLNYSIGYSATLKVYDGGTLNSPYLSLTASSLNQPITSTSATILIVYDASYYDDYGVVLAYDTGGNIATAAPTWANPPPPPPPPYTSYTSSSATTSSTYYTSASSSSSISSSNSISNLLGNSPSHSSSSDTFLPLFLGLFFGLSFLMVGFTVCFVVNQRRAVQRRAAQRAAAVRPTVTAGRVVAPPTPSAPPPAASSSSSASDHDESGPPVRANEVPMQPMPPSYNDVAPPKYDEVFSNRTTTNAGGGANTCRSCQAPLVRGARFCAACGSPVS